MSSNRPAGESTGIPRIALPLCLLLPFLVLVLVKSALVHHWGRESALLRVEAMTHRGQPLLGRRGTIFDCRGNAMAISEECYRIAVQGDVTELCRRVAGQCETDRPGALLLEWLVEVLRPDPADLKRLEDWLPRVCKMTSGYRVLCHHVEASRALQLLHELRVRGWSGFFEFEPVQRRIYPMDRVAAQVLGFIDDRGIPACGLENTLNRVLTGESGRHIAFRAPYVRKGSYNPDEWIEPREGKSAFLNLDSTVSWIAQEALAKTCEENRAEWGAAVVLDPQDGSVLAMESWPTFSPANFGEYADCKNRPFMNRAIHAAFQPGSIFKPYVMAAALEAGLVDLDETFDCGPGYRRFGRRRVRDHKPLGVLTTRQVLTKSSNTGMAQIGERLGKARMLSAIERFRLMEKTGVDLSGEISAQRPEWNDAYSLVSLSFGHEIQISPLRMAASFCAFANGGYVVEPRVVRAVLDEQGLEIPCSPPKRVRSLDPTALETVEELLVGVMTEGTGKLLQREFEGLEPGEVAGKSGTTQSEVPVDGKSHYIASFIAYAPVAAPRLLCLVVVDGPKGYPHSGSYVAGPAVASIISQSLQHLKEHDRTARPSRSPSGEGGTSR